VFDRTRVGRVADRANFLSVGCAVDLCVILCTRTNDRADDRRRRGAARLPRFAMFIASCRATARKQIRCVQCSLAFGHWPKDIRCRAAPHPSV